MQDDKQLHGNQVDCIRAARSSGSILKPFLFAAAQMDGVILPKTLLDDIPTSIAGFSPTNFDNAYDGVVPADEALYRSLNIPAVRLLNEYSNDVFHKKLQALSLESINKSSDHYGLSLILGGAETTLFDLAGAYASMSRSIQSFVENDALYKSDDFSSLQVLNVAETKNTLVKQVPLSAGASWLTFEALKQVKRPDAEIGWKTFRPNQDFAWKTGTSIGHRDAWAVGINADYVIGVWVGNADGEGRPGMTGVSVAAPILFDVLDKLPRSAWLEAPWDDLIEIPVCAHSGYRASAYCEQIDTATIHPAWTAYRFLVLFTKKFTWIGKRITE